MASNIFEALQNYGIRMLERDLEKRNSGQNYFGDTISRFGNEELAGAGYLARNAGNVAAQSLPEELGILRNVISYPTDMTNAALLAGFGLLSKGVAAGSEVLAGDSNREQQLTRDILGGLEVVGVGPQSRLAGILTKPALAQVPDAVMDTNFAVKSLLAGDVEGARSAFTPSMTPKPLSAAAVGHNGGPLLDDLEIPMTETDTLRDHVRMFSPSLLAAQNLPQNKGSYEQLRAWMLRNGAKADELSWSGIDSHFAGKTVTKDELIAKIKENAPKMIEGTSETALGVTGRYEDLVTIDYNSLWTDWFDANKHNEYVRVLKQFRNENKLKDTRMVKVRDADEDTLETLSERTGARIADLIKNDGDQYVDVDNPSYVMSELDALEQEYDIDSYVWENLWDRYNKSFSDPRTLDGEANTPELVDFAVSEGLYDANQFTDGFDKAETEYSSYFPKGGSNYTETQYFFTDPSRTLRSNDVPAPDHFGQERGQIAHARSATFPEVTVTPGPMGIPIDGVDIQRTGRDVFLLGEIQSDVAQGLRTAKLGAEEENLPFGLRNFEMMQAHGKGQQIYTEAVNRYQEEMFPLQENLYNLSPEDFLQIKDDYEFEQFIDNYPELREIYLKQTGIELPMEIADDFEGATTYQATLFQHYMGYGSDEALISRLREALPAPHKIKRTAIYGPDIEKLALSDVQHPVLDDIREKVPKIRAKKLEAIYKAEEFRKKGQGVPDGMDMLEAEAQGIGLGLRNSLPYADATTKWVDQVIRRKLYEALKEGKTQIFAIPNPDMVQKMTMGTTKGQGAFYGDIVPRRLQAIIKKIDPNVELKPFDIGVEEGGSRTTINMDYPPSDTRHTTTTYELKSESVYGFEINEDFLRKAAEKGIPLAMAPLVAPQLPQGILSTPERQPQNANSLLGFA